MARDKQQKAILKEVMKHTPRVHINAAMLPEIKDSKVGETYKILLTVTETGMQEDEDFGFGADFEIKKVEDKT